MMNSNPPARRLFGTILSTALVVILGACSDDSSKDSEQGTDTNPVTGDASTRDASTSDASPSTSDASTGTSDASISDAGGGEASACLSNVYSELSDGCSACTCAVDPRLAPSCQKPCWDFIACSFAAQAGKCAAAAAGGAATRAEFEACTMEECGAQLAVPGAEVVSSYRTIIGGCAVPMNGAKAACSDDVAKFTAGLKK